MKKALLLIVFYIFQSSLFSGTIPGYISYFDPMPGASHVKPGSTIIIRPFGSLTMDTFSKNFRMTVTGSKSGVHKCETILSDDKKTLIYKPNTNFSAGETVTVKIPENLKYTGDGKYFSFTFNIASGNVTSVNHNSLLQELNSEEKLNINHGPNRMEVNGLPNITISNSAAPSNGYIFLSNVVFSPTISNDPYLMVLDNNTQPLFAREMDKMCYDFKLQPNGFLTYYLDNNDPKFYEIDSAYNLIDSFYCGNSYPNDLHELRILSNGHALLMSYDPEIVDMSQVVAGGNPNAVVIGLIIQEIDRNKNVVFQWRSWDHYLITDATHEDLTAAQIDYVHGNALETDNDGNLLVSCRHMDEITKINRTTGDIIWRLGGKNNRFNFVNDPIGFSHQHAIRRIANGNITLFDNGNYHSPSFSRAVEYSLDEQNKTATLVWQYRNNPDIYGFAMGYVQRLNNGNTIIGWGAANPSVTEVKYDGTKVYEISLPDHLFSYRALKYDWKEKSQETVLPAAYQLGQNFPNPFNPSTSISFDISHRSNVLLTVYDALGRQVVELINSYLGPGTYTSVWDANGFASGVYYYKISAGDFSQTKKMILVK